MRKIVGILISLLLSVFSYATHQVGGYIAFKWMGGYTYQITVYDYTNCFPAYPLVADRDTLRLFFGDGTNSSRLLTRINGVPGCLVPGDANPTGEALCNWDFSQACPTPLDGARKVNIYQTTYTYSGPGNYHIWIDDLDRMVNIHNIINSVQVDYYMYSVITIPPITNFKNDSAYYINSVLVTNPPVCQYGCVGHCYKYNPGAYIPDLPPGADDSISYTLGRSLQLNPVNPTTPEVATGYYNPGATLNSSTGTLTWCPSSLEDTGIWNFVILMTTYQKVYESIGGLGTVVTQPLDTVELELEVNINSVCDSPFVSSKDTCVEAGSEVVITYTASSADKNPLYITTAGEPFFESPPATLSNYSPPSNPIHPVFKWLTNCEEVRENPYDVVITATEKVIQKPTDDSAFYSGYGTSRITVVGPPPQHLMAENDGTTVCLHWGPSACSQDSVYNIYRHKGCSTWQHGYCETGVPAYTGYTLIASIHGLYDTTFCDSNGGAGLSPGVSYSYIVDGSFPLPDGSQSYASNDTCVTIKLGVPLITNVSVTKTDPANGQMFVRWMKPIADSSDLDTTKYKPPYKYVLERATGMNGPNFVTVVTYTSSIFNTKVDSTFEDKGLDTQDSSYTYKVDFYDSFGYVGSSGTASSIYLRLQRESQSINMAWAASVPWVNDTFYVYRENPPPAIQAYNFIGKTINTTYTDTGLHNGSDYCYYVKSISQYADAAKVLHPLYDSSETACATPEDTIAPCAPPFKVMAKCTLYEDSIVWANPNNICPKANKVIHYQILYTPVENGDMHIIATLDSGATVYVSTDLASVAGCYAVVAVDSAGQTSPLSTICVDNCPDYQLPNVFTPNGDGTNDLYTPLEPYRYVKDIDINIYNRWGQVMFHTTDPNINWNGKVDNSGGDCPDGVYYYICTVNEIRVTGIVPITLRGFIQLIRN